MKETHPHRIYSNVSEREYALLVEICHRVGFKSVYALNQALIRAFLRYCNTGAYDDDEDTSIGREVEEMFDNLVDSPESFRVYKYTAHK